MPLALVVGVPVDVRVHAGLHILPDDVHRRPGSVVLGLHDLAPPTPGFLFNLRPVGPWRWMMENGDNPLALACLDR